MDLSHHLFSFCFIGCTRLLVCSIVLTYVHIWITSIDIFYHFSIYYPVESSVIFFFIFFFILFFIFSYFFVLCLFFGRFLKIIGAVAGVAVMVIEFAQLQLQPLFLQDPNVLYPPLNQPHPSLPPNRPLNPPPDQPLLVLHL